MLPERWMTQAPDRMILVLDEVYDIAFMESLANAAVDAVQDRLPKITGSLSRSIKPVFGQNFFGVYFPDKRAWYLERGTRAFTMNSLAGKTIPMWVDDPDGSVAKAQGRKTKTRVTIDGRHQTLIFRKAANKGTRKIKRDKNGKIVSTPASYPGAPGRIGNPRGNYGRIAAGNVGVRWRHPGILGRGYMNQAIEDTCDVFGIEEGQLYLVDAATYPSATKA